VSLHGIFFIRNERTSSSDVLAEPTSFSSSPTRRSISAMSLAGSGALCEALASSPSAFASFSGAISAAWSAGGGSLSTSWTSRARPSCPAENFASRALTSTRPLRRSPGSTWPCSRSRTRSGLAGSASSDSREVSSDCSSFKRRAREGGCVGVGDGVREGGYLYKDRSRVPTMTGKLEASSGGSYRRLRSARRNRLLASVASTRLLSSIPSAAV
jgi:hypothetical protein